MGRLEVSAYLIVRRFPCHSKMKIDHIIALLVLGGLAGCSSCSSVSSPKSPAYSVVSTQEVDWGSKRPIELIEELKQHPKSIYTIWFVPKEWILEQDLPGLITLLDSETPCASTVSADSSTLPPPGSTVGHEAAFLIQGFREGRYPAELNSSRFTPDKTEIRNWWNTLKKRK